MVNSIFIKREGDNFSSAKPNDFFFYNFTLRIPWTLDNCGLYGLLFRSSSGGGAKNSRGLCNITPPEITIYILLLASLKKHCFWRNLEKSYCKFGYTHPLLALIEKHFGILERNGVRRLYRRYIRPSVTCHGNRT